MNKILGMKVYDNDWFLKFHFSYSEVAKILKDWGVNLILTQSKYIPMPDTAVKSEISKQEKKLYNSYSDLKFREALANEGIDYYATILMFFDPSALAINGKLSAYDKNLKKMKKIDWYIGIPPTMERHVENKITLLTKAVKELNPDGVHLAFMRWPGFWELWMPNSKITDFNDYSFDNISIKKFFHDCELTKPKIAINSIPEWINENYSNEWISWKCRVVQNVISNIKFELKRIKPDLKIMLNTVPFGKSDYNNAQDKIFGQNFELLSEIVDTFEVMTYHQILKRTPEWIKLCGEEIKNRTKKNTICTIQAQPLYLEGIHKKENRNTSLNENEFNECLEFIKDSNIDGVVVFLFTDFLNQYFKEKNKNLINKILNFSK